jgi:hypothetical protein
MKDLVLIPEHITVTHFDDNAIILDSRNGKYFGLNSSAAEFFKSLQASQSISMSLDTFSSTAHNVGHEVIQKDIHELIDKLLEMGVIQFVNK